MSNVLSSIWATANVHTSGLDTNSMEAVNKQSDLLTSTDYSTSWRTSVMETWKAHGSIVVSKK
jgi:hypothetical protein